MCVYVGVGGSVGRVCAHLAHCVCGLLSEPVQAADLGVSVAGYQVLRLYGMRTRVRTYASMCTLRSLVCRNRQIYRLIHTGGCARVCVEHLHGTYAAQRPGHDTLPPDPASML